MRFTETKLKGAFIIDLERREDERGFFARTFCQNEMMAHGLCTDIAQSSIASNKLKGTLRGMHFQFPPAAECKLVSCVRGGVLDVIVDLRPESATYLKHVTVQLDADNKRALYVPERFAHGYQTLCDDTETSSQISQFYAPETQGGLRHDDPRLAISWPLPVAVIAPKDEAFAALDACENEMKRRMAAI